MLAVENLSLINKPTCLALSCLVLTTAAFQCLETRPTPSNFLNDGTSRIDITRISCLGIRGRIYVVPGVHLISRFYNTTMMTTGMNYKLRCNVEVRSFVAPFSEFSVGNTDEYCISIPFTLAPSSSTKSYLSE